MVRKFLEVAGEILETLMQGAELLSPDSQSSWFSIGELVFSISILISTLYHHAFVINHTAIPHLLDVPTNSFVI